MKRHTIESLWGLEEAGWRALSDGSGRAFYEEVLADEVLMIFPGGAAFGRQQILASMGGQPWAWFKLADRREIILTDDSVLLTYRATAQREGQPVYDAWMSSGYVRRDGHWRLAFHQQTLV